MPDCNDSFVISDERKVNTYFTLPSCHYVIYCELMTVMKVAYFEGLLLYSMILNNCCECCCQVKISLCRVGITSVKTYLVACIGL
jgi:hypothetical protein